MKKLIASIIVLVVLIVIGIAAFQAIDTVPTDNAAGNAGTVTQQESQATPTPTPAPATQEPTREPEVTEEQPTASVVYDADGKLYFVGDAYKAFSLALEADIQARLNQAEVGELRVYDVMREGDRNLIDSEKKEINLLYGIDTEEIPEEVTILRDGYAIFTWDEEDFVISEKEDKIFSGATDSQFTAKVYCNEHKAVNSRVTIAYPESLEWAEGTRKGVRGPFDTEKLDASLYEAFVLVKRQVTIDGESHDGYTWVARTCGCSESTSSAPTQAPVVVNPTVVPTTEPTVVPTVEPTQEPTVKPTVVPTTEPTVVPTVEPTQEPTVNPTVVPTTEPTVVPTVEPTQEPTVKPTQAPTVKPTSTPDYEPTGTPPVEVVTTPEPTGEPEYEPVGTPPVEVVPTAKPTAEPTLRPSDEEFVVSGETFVTESEKEGTSLRPSDEKFEVSEETFVTESEKDEEESEEKESGESFDPGYSIPGGLPPMEL